MLVETKYVVVADEKNTRGRESEHLRRYEREEHFIFLIFFFLLGISILFYNYL